MIDNDQCDDLRTEINELRAELAALKAQPVQEPVATAYKNLMLSGICGAVFHQEVPSGTKLYAAPAQPVPLTEATRQAIALAYGHLWHINNEPLAPIPLRSEESASYAARKLLRDLLTHEERGEAINAVRQLLEVTIKGGAT